MSCPSCGGTLVKLDDESDQCKDCGLVVTYLDPEKED